MEVFSATFPKVSEVEIEDGVIRCRIDLTRPPMDIRMAYNSDSPAHVEFLNLTEDPKEPREIDEWRYFVFKWGPLWHSQPSYGDRWGAWPLGVLISEQAVMKATKELSAAFRTGRELRAVLRDP